jgi:hypothetical protein
MLALLRPDEFNHPLLLHVGGAMILVGVVIAQTGGAARTPSELRIADE